MEFSGGAPVAVLPSSILHLRFLLFLALAVFIWPAARRRGRARCCREKTSGPRRLCRRGGAIEDRHDVAGHERGGVELLRRRAATRRPAGGRGAGVSKRAEVRPRLGGGALQSRLPLAGAEQAGTPPGRNSPPTRCGATTRRKAGSNSARRNSSCTTSSRRKKVSAPRYPSITNNAEALNGLGLARVAGGHPQDAAQIFRRRHPGASRLRARAAEPRDGGASSICMTTRRR